MIRAAKLAALSTLVFALPAGGSARAASWLEVGDAGDHTTPQLTQGTGNLSEIHGSLAVTTTDDPSDAFVIGYGGAPGALVLSVSFDEPLPNHILVSLFDEQGAVLGQQITTLSFTDLPAGTYVVEAGPADSGQGPDPAYTLLLDGPETGAGGVLFGAPLPEPASIALCGVTLALLAVTRRRRS
jgi:hypothetical protein